VTGRAILRAFSRAGSEILVAADALLMKGVGTLRDVLISGVFLMAFAAGLGVRILVLFKGVMAVAARDAVP